MSDPIFESSAFTPDELVGAGSPIVTRDVTLTDIDDTGPLVRGTVLGMDGDGKYGISLVAEDDGSEVPRAILARDADPSDGDVTATIYEAGEFNLRRLTIGTGHTAASIVEPLRSVSIFVRQSVAR